MYHKFGDWFRQNYIDFYLSWIESRKNNYEHSKKSYTDGPNVLDKSLYEEYVDLQLSSVLTKEEYEKIKDEFENYLLKNMD